MEYLNFPIGSGSHFSTKDRCGGRKWGDLIILLLNAPALIRRGDNSQSLDWVVTNPRHTPRGGLDHGFKAPCFVHSLASYFLFFDRGQPTNFLPNIPQQRYTLYPIILTWSHSLLFGVWDHILFICLQLHCSWAILGRNLGRLLFKIDSNRPFNFGTTHKTLYRCLSRQDE